MKKLALLLFFMFFLSFFLFSQDTNSKKQRQHTIFFELGGNTFTYYNISYDYKLKLKDKHKIAFGIGVQYFPYIRQRKLVDNEFSLSPQISYLYGKKHHLEVGLGFPTFFTYPSFYDGSCFEGIISLRIGYRYQKEDGGLFWRISYTPGIFYVVKMWDDIYVPLWGGIAIGYTFK